MQRQGSHKTRGEIADEKQHLNSWAFLASLAALQTPISYFWIDLAYLPLRWHPVAAVLRGLLVIAGAIAVILRYMRPEIVLRQWRPCLLALYVYHVAILIFFEALSADILRSRYYIGIITITGLTLVFRVQRAILVLYVASVIVYAYVMRNSEILYDSVFDFFSIGVFFFGIALRHFSSERALEKAVDQRNEIIATINHGWLVPFAAIADLANKLGRESKNAAHKAYANLIRYQALYMHTEASELIDNARPAMRPSGPVAAGTRLRAVLENAVATVAAIRKARIEMQRIPTIEIAMKSQDVFRVLVALLSNSVDYSPDGRCQVTFGVHTKYLQVIFQNQIVERELPQPASLFDRYTTGPRGGAGIGLYNCRKLLEGVGGSIRLDVAGAEVRFIASFPVMTGGL